MPLKRPELVHCVSWLNWTVIILLIEDDVNFGKSDRDFSLRGKEKSKDEDEKKLLKFWSFITKLSYAMHSKTVLGCLAALSLPLPAYNTCPPTIQCSLVYRVNLWTSDGGIPRKWKHQILSTLLLPTRFRAQEKG